MIKRFIICTLLGTLLACGPLWAQRFEMDTSFMAGIPQGEFSHHVDSTGLGFNMRFAFMPRSLGPFSFGGEFTYLQYGSEQWSEPLIADVPDVLVDVHTTNNILLSHAFLRVQPRHGTVRPYAEGLIGASYLFTDTSIEGSGDESIASSINFDDTALSWGFGAGVLFVPWSAGGMRGPYPARVAFGIEAGLRYLFGGQAEYLREGSIERFGDVVIYHVFRSNTNLLLPHVGFVVRF